MTDKPDDTEGSWLNRRGILLVPRHIGSDCLILGGMETWEVVAFDENDDGARHAGFA